MQIVSFAAGKNRDQGRDRIFIEQFYKGCLSCGIHQSMTYQCNSLRPLFAVMAATVKHTHTLTQSKEQQQRQQVKQVVLSYVWRCFIPWPSLHFDSVFAAFVTNQQKWLKVKGDSTLPHPHPTQPPAPPPDDFKAAASFIFFLFQHSTWLRALVLMLLMKWGGVGGGRRKTPKPADTVSLKFYFRTVNAVF